MCHVTYLSGPGIPVNAKGRAEAHGYVLSGSDAQGYRARIVVPLTADEVAYGCEEILFSESLADLLARTQAQKIIRSMVGQARGTSDAQEA